MKIAAYLRVSSESQNTDPQRTEIAQWAKREGVEVTWYEDMVSAKENTHRPSLDLLLQDVAKGGVKTVIIWKLDRLARSQREGINILCKLCDKKIRVVSLTEDIDFSGVLGRMLASVIFGLAEIERENIRTRQQAGIAIARERGGYSGRKRGTTKADPARARELARRGFATREIATSMAISERSVRRYKSSV